MWIKRILIFSAVFQIFLTILGPIGYLSCKFGSQFFCQGMQESYSVDMEAFSVSLETAIFGGVLQGTFWIVVTLILLWALKKRKHWFFKGALIYTVVFLIFSFDNSVFFIEFISTTILLILLLKNRKGLSFT